MVHSSKDANVFELPRVLVVEIFGKKPLAIVERCPIAMHPDHLAEIGAGDIEDAREIHPLGLGAPVLPVARPPGGPRRAPRGYPAGGWRGCAAPPAAPRRLSAAIRTNK